MKNKLMMMNWVGSQRTAQLAAAATSHSTDETRSIEMKSDDGK